MDRVDLAVPLELVQAGLAVALELAQVGLELAQELTQAVSLLQAVFLQVALLQVTVVMAVVTALAGAKQTFVWTSSRTKTAVTVVTEEAVAAVEEAVVVCLWPKYFAPFGTTNQGISHINIETIGMMWLKHHLSDLVELDDRRRLRAWRSFP